MELLVTGNKFSSLIILHLKRRQEASEFRNASSLDMRMNVDCVHIFTLVGSKKNHNDFTPGPLSLSQEIECHDMASTDVLSYRWKKFMCISLK